MLQEYNHLIFLEAPTLNEMKSFLTDNIKEDVIVEFDPAKHEMDIELLITVGGDGTILWTVNYFQNRSLPPMFTIDRVNTERGLLLISC